MNLRTLKLFLIFSLFAITGFAFADSDGVVINNNINNVIMHTEYQCKISNADCVVDKIKNMQTGDIYYDAECNASHMMKSSFENNVINDVKSGVFNYCSKTGSR